MLVLAATLLLSVTDPQDANGDGGYSLPAGIESSQLDVREFGAYNDNGKLELRIRMAQLKNQANAPMGFSGPQLELFIDDGSGRENVLGATGFRAANAAGWRYHIEVNGWKAMLTENKTNNTKTQAQNIEVQIHENEIVLHPALPSNDYSYYLLAGVHDPLDESGLRQVSSSASVFDLASSLPDAPAAVDVLSPDSQIGFYSAREVPPVGKIPDRRPWLLVSGLAGLLLSALATVLGSRK